MAYHSIAYYHVDGEQSRFSVPFPYLDRAHVHVYVQTIETRFHWVNDHEVELVVPATDNEYVRVQRTTPFDPVVDFYDSSNLRADELNDAYRQSVYLLQEQQDALQSGLIGGDDTGGPLSKLFEGGLTDGTAVDELVTRLAATELYQELVATKSQLDDTATASLQNALSIDEGNNLHWRSEQDIAGAYEASLRAALGVDKANNDQYRSQVQINQLGVAVENNAAGITETRGAIADAKSALAERIITIRAIAEDNKSVIQEASTALSDEDKSLAQKLTALVSLVDDSSAAIKETQKTLATNTESLAESIETVQSSVGNNRTTIQETKRVTDGIIGEYVVGIDNNGRFGGVRILSETGASGSNLTSLDIVGDSLRFLDPDDLSVQIGYINGTLRVNGNIIADGSVSAQKINVEQLSALSSYFGLITGGTFRTTKNPEGMRAVMTSEYAYPFWYGAGEYTWDNAVFALDKDGDAKFRGRIEAESGYFSGELRAATGVFSGEIRAASGTFAGKLTAGAFNAVGTGNIVGGAVSEYVSTFQRGPVDLDNWNIGPSASIGIDNVDDEMVLEITVTYAIEVSSGAYGGDSSYAELAFYKEGSRFGYIDEARSQNTDDDTSRGELHIPDKDYASGSLKFYDVPGVNTTYDIRGNTSSASSPFKNLGITLRIFKR